MEVHNEEHSAEQRVTFTPEQQSKIDEIVRAAMGRAAAETRRELETEQKRTAELDVRLKQAEEKTASSERERDQAITERDDVAKRLHDARKQQYIAEQCVEHDFVDAPTIASLTESSLRWSDESASWEAVNSDGSVVSAQEFFGRFASERPYLVRSDVRAGNGSNDSSRSSLINHQRYKPEEIFGKGSDSRLANDLAKKNPEEYRRLKNEARAKRLI